MILFCDVCRTYFSPTGIIRGATAGEHYLSPRTGKVVHWDGEWTSPKGKEVSADIDYNGTGEFAICLPLPMNPEEPHNPEE